MYMQNFLIAVDTIIIVGLLVLVGLSLLKQGYKNSTNQLFAAFSVMAIIWIVSSDISNDISVASQIALYAKYVAFSSSLAAVIIILQFVVRLSGISFFKKLLKISLLPLWLVCIISATPLAVASVAIKGDIYAVSYGPLVWTYALGMIYGIGCMLYVIIYGIYHSDGVRKQRLKIVGISLLIALPIALVFRLLIPLLTGITSFNRLASAPILVLVIGLYYSAVRYRLFDIRAAAVRTLAYVMSLGVLVVIYYILATVISGLFLNNNATLNQSPLSIGLALGLLFIFQPVKKFFDRLTNNIFYRDNYNSDEFFARFNRLLTSTIDLHHLLEHAATEIASTLKSEQAFFFVHTMGEKHVISGTAGRRQISKQDIESIHQAVHGKIDKIKVASLTEEEDPIYHLMARNHIAMILPLIGSKVIGFLCIGDHLTSHYTNRDIQVLCTISDGLSVAIQNALSILEIKEINAVNLQQRIDSATKELRTSNDLLRQMDAEKDEFVSVASHELRTPMTVIRGYISLLGREQLGTLSDPQKDILNKMSINTKGLIDLVNNMLDLSKLESNKFEVQISNQPLDKLVSQSIEEMKILYASKSINLSYADSNVQIKTDPEKFRRIMMNLLDNAYKFTPIGGNVTITSKADKETNLVTVCIDDTGIGISADALGGLFRKFSQVDNYLERQLGGSGLGLAICKGLVEKLGGTIGVKSELGFGSKFCFTMPIVNDKK